ncbi:MAG: rhodanese-like domain-containing protein [Bacillota bacterium]|nr:rhodanese-like domain-containing protein [Bacillota bacterium]
MKNVIILSVLLLVSISMVGCGQNQSNDESMDDAPEVIQVATVNSIDAETAIEMMASGEDFILVDVRTQAEFDEGHIEGALLLPVDQIETLSVEQLPNKDAVVLVYCRSGNRSDQASKILVDLGYQNVYDFGGIIDWPGEIVK